MESHSLGSNMSTLAKEKSVIPTNAHPHADHTTNDNKQDGVLGVDKRNMSRKPSVIYKPKFRFSSLQKSIPKWKATDPSYVPPKSEDSTDDDEPIGAPDPLNLDTTLKFKKDSPYIQKSSAVKRKVADPTYTPRMDNDSSDDPEHHTYGLHTPGQTPRKRKTLPDLASGLPSTMRNASQGPPKRRKTMKSVDPDFMPYATPDAAFEPVKQVIPSCETWEHETHASNPERFDEYLQGVAIPVNATKRGRASSRHTSGLYSPITTGSNSTPSPKSEPLSPSELATIPKKKRAEMSSKFELHHSDDEETEDNTPFRISKNEKTAVVFDFSLEKAKRWADAINIPPGVYTNEESDLFFRLAMRGFEPLVPRKWRYDFPTLPELLYPALDDKAEALIQALEGSEFYGIKSLAHLFALGGHVRDCSVMRTSPESLIGRYVRKYIRWAVDDAKLHASQDAIPVHVIQTQKRGETTLETVKKLNQRLQRLANGYRNMIGLRPPDNLNTGDLPKYPLLVGFVICGPIIAILTLSTDPAGSSEFTDSRFISQFDLGERGQDVWNSLAVAITVMHIRRTMIQLADEGVGGFSKVQGGLLSESQEDL
ncbi:hypothetical protein FE257_007329 [Aspergillus nanangensis]|uniref:Uncharacterized protein n=1 Tax=Aspergillus nanangensis TaxID=2582783 RepID=A0AAD4CPN1_ASPNN|nr:hypothetical protein FE257_007329 [Aspergillus nanangensis]